MALALTLAAHLTLGGFWLASRAQAPRGDAASHRVGVLMLVPAQASVRARAPARVPARARAAVALANPIAPARPMPVTPALVMTAPRAPMAPDAHASPDAPVPTATAPLSAPPAPAAFAVDPLRQRALRGVAQIARELGPAAAREGASEPASLRLARLMENAHIDRSLGVGLERRVSPDGVVITRVRRNGGVSCYMSGTVNFVPGILHDSARPQTVNCPSEKDGWSRD